MATLIGVPCLDAEQDGIKIHIKFDFKDEAERAAILIRSLKEELSLYDFLEAIVEDGSHFHYVTVEQNEQTLFLMAWHYNGNIAFIRDIYSNEITCDSKFYRNGKFAFAEISENGQKKRGYDSFKALSEHFSQQERKNVTFGETLIIKPDTLWQPKDYTGLYGGPDDHIYQYDWETPRWLQKAREESAPPIEPK